MRKEAKILHAKAVDSLIIAVDHFNRAWNRGRPEAVLIMLDRAFELLLKAIIVHMGGDIREKGREGMTIGFDACLRKCMSDSKTACLTSDDVIALQSLNTLRDAAQHHMIELPEELLYIHSQSGLTMFKRLANQFLEKPLRNEVPQRILPVCANPPSELESIFDIEFADIKRLVRPSNRRRLDAKARLRSMAILEASLAGRKSQPTDRELDAIVRRINRGTGWRDIFPGVATLTIHQDPTGPGLTIRIKNNQGEAVQLVSEGDPSATVVAVKPVNELGFYNLGANDLAKKLDLSIRELCWILKDGNLQSNSDFHKLIKIGKSSFKRYSWKCLHHIQSLISSTDVRARYANTLKSPRKR